MTAAPPNSATIWAEILVEELYRAGLRRVCIAPGSRSTALTMAFAAHPDIRHFIHLDERSAAFFALGLALESGEPAALVCTSGTAAAEFFPAVIEASQSNVPMLMLTADRPPELRQSGANQTIDQIKLYGNFVRWSVDAPLPEKDPSQHLIRSLRTLANRALAVAQGLNSAPGPVHINLPFRRPLEPSLVSGDATPQYPPRDGGAPWTRIHISSRYPNPDLIAELGARMHQAPRGLIIAGPRCPKGDFPAALADLSAATGFPVLADPLSGLRFGPHTARGSIIAGYSLALQSGLLAEAPLPQLVLRFGAMPVSQALSDYLESLPEDIPQIGIDPHGGWYDPIYTNSEFIAADPLALVRGLILPTDNFSKDIDWAKLWASAEEQVWAALQTHEPYEGKLVADLVNALPAEARLFVANSLPIRHVDECAATRLAPLQISANRGASGIDGTNSTALGVAAASAHPLALLTGDISLYYDQNGLLALREAEVQATIVLINNNGGGIFHRLPIADFEPSFTELFATPHGLDFKHTARLFGLNHSKLSAKEAPSALAEAMSASEARLLEIQTDAAESERIRRELVTNLKAKGFRPK